MRARGGFEPLSATAVDYPIETMDAADIDGDGDGDTDLFLEISIPATFSGWSPGIAMLAGDGAENFTVNIQTVGERLEDRTLADIDGDGDADVVYEGSWHSDPPRLKVLRYASDGRFYGGSPVVLPDRIFGHALGDLDHD